MNETFNMTLNQTKIDKIDKERDHYCRAPILSFLYDLPSECESGQEFIPSKELYVINISQSEYQQKL